MKMLPVFLCTLILWQSGRSDTDVNPVVKTTLGPIQGKLLKMTNQKGFKDVYAFLGIPYAQPPVGPLRFRKPEPVKSWTGIYDAMNFSNICIQSMEPYEIIQWTAGGEPAEDCLYLNIWTPADAMEDKTTSKAVMVFIHGCGLTGGSASQPYYHGEYISSVGDVVMVTMNYRVGALGFLSLGVEDAPGNQGLWDQRMALLWVQEHIANFGGDPNLVTIFGHNAGSASVGAHLLSPRTRGLYHRAIMQSGTPNTPVLVATPEDALNITLSYAYRQGCYDPADMDSKDATILKIIDCLRQLDISQITKLEDEHSMEYPAEHVKLLIGDEYIPDLNKQNIPEDHKPIDLMIGVTANEGSMLLAFILLQLNETDTEFEYDFAKEISRKLLSVMPETVINNAIELYFQHLTNTSTSDTLKQTVSHLIGDYAVTCPEVYFAEYFAKNNPVYFYYFNHRHSHIPYAEWTGVNHGEDMQYVFWQPMFENATHTEEELEFGRQLMDLWTTFGKTGKPRVPGIDSWPQYSEDNAVYVNLKPNNYQTGIGPHLRSCNFWKHHLPRPK